MQSQRRAVVDPKDILVAEISAERRYETPRGGRALIAANVGKLLVANARGGLVSPSQAYQGRGGPNQFGAAVEYEDFGVLLVDDYEWEPLVVLRTGHPVCDLMRIIRRRLADEIG